LAVKYLLKTTEEFRLETLDDVKQFHTNLEKDAAEQEYNLSGFSWSEKYEKEKGEVIGSYFVVKAIKVFDEAKMPEQSPLESITYSHYEVPSEFVEDATEEGDLPW